MATPPQRFDDLGDQIEKGNPIHIILVDRLAPVATFGEVIKGARKLDT